jgi:alpha-L-arabinofuranosidase
MKNTQLQRFTYLISIFITILCCSTFSSSGCDYDRNNKQTGNNNDQKATSITINIPDQPSTINPMIYGQMLEDCNDQVIYGGIVGKNGESRPHVDEMLKPLQISVMRWPGGTFVHEYQWKYGIGPVDERPVVNVQIWGGIENHRFGTDEFLQWCKKLDIEPYINFNMGNHPTLGGTVQEALDWIEYVNGSENTEFGKKRLQNGHSEKYGVKYWCIGNENGSSSGEHTGESDKDYAERLEQWAKIIRDKHPDLELLAVGGSYNWDKTVLEKNGSLIDFITHHYYVNSRFKDNKIVNPRNSLFAPAKLEAHLIKVGELLNEMNDKLERRDNPIMVSIDEWNNRHQIFDGTDFKFTRHDPRRQFDVAVAAGMLNVFIRQCSTVAMANYIFPVNGHGLIRTIGENDAYRTPIYYVFQLYRQLMIGNRIDIQIDGPGISVSEIDFSIVGDCREMNLDDETLNYVDGAAVLTSENLINIALINRSPDKSQKVKLSLPENYFPVKKWEIQHSDINSTNSADNRDEIKPIVTNIHNKPKAFLIPPCGLIILKLSKR